MRTRRPESCAHTQLSAGTPRQRFSPPAPSLRQPVGAPSSRSSTSHPFPSFPLSRRLSRSRPPAMSSNDGDVPTFSAPQSVADILIGPMQVGYQGAWPSRLSRRAALTFLATHSPARRLRRFPHALHLLRRPRRAETALSCRSTRAHLLVCPQHGVLDHRLLRELYYGGHAGFPARLLRRLTPLPRQFRKTVAHSFCRTGTCFGTPSRCLLGSSQQSPKLSSQRGRAR